ncbi:carbohydrate kinase family protein [Halosegnis marinus]|uniref:PfkB family carbohydrate kinase n=1 Tax=Halosegnis marinus TaxID=3034023 RepID=A0ABD5ZP88_9EURY|nr:carbohydrate kinase family protein [Halosegnis sp. DT85]
MADAPELVTVGGAMVDRYYTLSNLPEPDGGSYVRERRDGVGGVAANVASAAARLGRDTGIVSRVGEDAAGDTVLADLRERGVDTDRVRRGPEESTYSLVFRADGERMVVTGGESCAALALAEGDRPYLRDAGVVAATAYVPERAADPLVAMAEADEVTLAFDLSGPLAELADRAMTPATIDRAVGACDLFLAGEVALAAYLDHHGADDPVAFLRERGVERAALTRGADGATLLTPDGTLEIDAFDVEVTDATGAGDAFLAALADAWLLDGNSPEEAGRFAAAVAACNCRGDGARGGLPTREEALALLR